MRELQGAARSRKEHERRHERRRRSLLAEEMIAGDVWRYGMMFRRMLRGGAMVANAAQS